MSTKPDSNFNPSDYVMFVEEEMVGLRVTRLSVKVRAGAHTAITRHGRLTGQHALRLYRDAFALAVRTLCTQATDTASGEAARGGSAAADPEALAHHWRMIEHERSANQAAASAHAHPNDAALEAAARAYREARGK